MGCEIEPHGGVGAQWEVCLTIGLGPGVVEKQISLKTSLQVQCLEPGITRLGLHVHLENVYTDPQEQTKCHRN